MASTGKRYLKFLSNHNIAARLKLHFFLFLFRVVKNIFMMRQGRKAPKVTPCLIFIQETAEDKPPYRFDIYQLETAVRKYHIRLGQNLQNYGGFLIYLKMLSRNQCPYVGIFFQVSRDGGLEKFFHEGFVTRKWVHPLIVTTFTWSGI